MVRGDLSTTVAVHGRETLKIGTLRCILRDIELSPSDFAKIWKA